MYIIKWNPWLFESTKTKFHRGCIMYINAEALHGGLIWECYFHFLYRNYILFHQAALSLQLLLLTLQYMLRFVRNSAINGQGVAFWFFLYVIILYIQTQIWWHTPPLWGTWEAFLPWTWRNWSINYVCSIKLLSHCLNYSSTMLFNPAASVEAANSHTKRIFLFVSVLALI